MKQPTFGSLFAGIGGFDLGFERAGFACKWQVEIDPWCRRVLEKHWPDVRRHDDVRTFPPTDRAEWSVDVICGGFPCQDISVAGLGAGIDGARSGLWTEYARIVRAIRPRFVVVENVSALLARGIDRVLGDLAACGYDAEWDCIPASAVGAPHRRDRLFVVAYPNGERCEEQHAPGIAAIPGLDHRSRHAGSDAEGIERRQGRTGRTAGPGAWEEDAAKVAAVTADATGGRRDAAPRPKQGRGAAFDGKAGPFAPVAFGGRSCVERSRWWLSEPGVDRVVDGIPPPVDRLRGLGNAVVPQVIEWIARRLLTAINEHTVTT